MRRASAAEPRRRDAVEATFQTSCRGDAGLVAWRAMNRARQIVIARAAAEAVKRGHPWVWRQALSQARALAHGEDVQVVADDGAPLGHAIADAESPIALRMWTSGRAPIDDALVKSRIDAALGARARMFAD